MTETLPSWIKIDDAVGAVAVHGYGGFLGVVLAALWFCHRRKLSFLAFSDVMACVSPIGIFFVRIANYINGELWGKPTELPWGMLVEGQVLHPSQLYEAALDRMSREIAAVEKLDERGAVQKITEILARSARGRKAAADEAAAAEAREQAA